MEDTGGKSGRRPARHLQVEASGPGNAAGVQQRLGGKVDTPDRSSGPGWEIQEVSRLGAQGVTSKSKLLAREMPRVCSGGLRVDSGESLRRKVAVRGQAPKSDGRCALLERARAEVLRVRRCHPEPADVLVSVEVTNPLSKPLELCTEV